MAKFKSSYHDSVASTTAAQVARATGSRTVAFLKALSEEDYAHLSKVRASEARELLDRLIPPASAYTVVGPYLSVVLLSESEIMVPVRILRPRFARELDVAEVMCA